MLKFPNNMSKTTILKLLFTFLLISGSLQAQVTKDIPNYFPVSPNAASFAKQGLFPVDYSTGKINISIPIYTIKTKELTVPISMSYNSAGIQLDELSSWVGLGWNLNAGGAIVRNVKGIPDTGTVPELANLAFTAENYLTLYNSFRSELVDTAYDEFIINAPGLSGTFYFVNDKPVFRDLQNTTVVKTITFNNQAVLTSSLFEVTKDDGTIYRFGKSLDGYNAYETARNSLTGITKDYISSWYLTEIIPPNSKNSNDVISFKYKLLENVKDYDIIIGEKMANSSVNPQCLVTLNSIYPGRSGINSSSKQYLTSINFNNGVIDFYSTQNREDLADDFKLDKISVYSLKASIKTLIQEYGFNYSYYYRSGGNVTNPELGTGYDNLRNRNSRSKSLKLNQITNNVLNVKHTFEYEGTQLPLRGTTAKDYWGYINGNMGNLSPPTSVQSLSQYGNQMATCTIGNGNRSANENLMKSGILKKITYPEGGYSIFEYEANKYFVNEDIPIIRSKSYSAMAGGVNCTIPIASSQTTFVPAASNYIQGSGKITYTFTEGSQEYGGTTRVVYDGTIYNRPLYTGGKFPSQTVTLLVSFGSSTHTISAYEYRSGQITAYGCPLTSITASWDELGGYETRMVTKLVGGLRIASIKSYDAKDPNPVFTKLYKYEDENILVKEGNGSYVRGVFAEDRASDVFPIFSTSSIFDNNMGGSPAITYGKVTEIDSNPNNTQQNGKTEYYYQNVPYTRLFDITGTTLPTIFKNPAFNTMLSMNIGQTLSLLNNFSFYKNDLWNQGSLLKTNTYKNGATPNTFKIVKSVVNQYAVLKQSTLPYNIVFNNFPSQLRPGDYPLSFAIPYNQGSDFYSGQFYYAVGQTSQGKKVVTSTIETDYDANEIPTTQKTTTYGYQNPVHNQVTKTETINSKGETLRTQLTYPQELILTGQAPEMQKLVTQNKIDKPIKTETFVNDLQTSESITKYEESTATGNVLLPKEIHSTKGTNETFPFNDANRKINFTLYDTDVVNGVTVGNGNVLEYSVENGTPVSIIWGYNKTQPIAKIENANYNQVSAYAATLQSISNTGIEIDLITALNALRSALPNAMITTYTYIPLVGVSTITDPKGDKITYTYDPFGRLQFVKDKNDNILSENQYNYKQ